MLGAQKHFYMEPQVSVASMQEGGVVLVETSSQFPQFTQQQLASVLNVQFKDMMAVPPRAFSILANRNREAYKTKEALIWPFSGAALPAIQRMMDTFEAALKEVEAGRAALSVAHNSR